MPRTPITQQTSTTLSLQGELSRSAPSPKSAVGGTFGGPLQWALEGAGWRVLRPTVDFVLVCLAVIVAQGGLHKTLYPSTYRAPLMLLPVIVLLLFYLRGLYRTRLRALVLDGVVPVISAISIGAMSAAVLGLFVNGTAPPQSATVRTWLFALLGVGFGRIVLSTAQRWARARRRVGKPVLIMGAGVVGAQVARRLESHPEYGLAPIGFLDEDRARSPRSAAATCRCSAPSRTSTRRSREPACAI